MKFISTIAAPSFGFLILTGCTTSSEISVPEISSDSAANLQSSSRSRTTSLPHLGEDAITRATSSCLDGNSPNASEMSMPMDHGGMKMDDGDMKIDYSNMNMKPEKSDPSPVSPASADSYTCTMHPVFDPVPAMANAARQRRFRPPEMGLTTRPP